MPQESKEIPSAAAWSPRTRLKWGLAVIAVGVFLFTYFKPSQPWKTAAEKALEAQGYEPMEGPFLLNIFHHETQPIICSAKAKSDTQSDLFIAWASMDGDKNTTPLHFYNLTHSYGSSEVGLKETATKQGFGYWVKSGDKTIAYVEQHSRVSHDRVSNDRAPHDTRTLNKNTLHRLQSNITQWLETGSTHDFILMRADFPPANEAEVISKHPLKLRLDGKEVAPDFRTRNESDASFVAWAVDSVRGVVGSAPIEWLEHHAFNVADWFEQQKLAWGLGKVTGNALQEEMGLTGLGHRTHVGADDTLDVPSIPVGFPPENIAPIFKTPLEGEGVWKSIHHDPFVNETQHAPPAFATTYLRPDPTRGYAKVFVVLWDPRQVQLRTVAGTKEPQSATGRFGTGRLPSDPKHMSRLVGAFNGGFQAMHGEFGMMADGQVYLPPKPWAATLAIDRSGRIAMGAWQAPNWSGTIDERLANAQIPPDIIDFRQNLTNMVEDGVYNPWDRWWWGASPKQTTEQTYTHRTGICMTEDGFMAYFWGTSLSADALGAAMVQTQCSRAMHLDMNSAHCGFEFYHPFAPGSAPPPLTDFGLTALDVETQFEGAFPIASGWTLRARKAVNSMGMRFPRFHTADARDFFYLMLKPILPGPDLRLNPTQQITFSTEGLPHAGYPSALAKASVSLGGDTITLIRIDPNRVDFKTSTSLQSSDTVLGGLSVIAADPRNSTRLLEALRAYKASLLLGTENRLASPELLAPYKPGTDGSFLTIDEHGFILLAIGEARSLGQLASRLLTQQRPSGQQLYAASFDLGEAAGRATDIVVAAEKMPQTRVLFPEVTPMKYYKWGPLQDQRVRYIPEKPPRFIRGQAPLPPP